MLFLITKLYKLCVFKVIVYFKWSFHRFRFFSPHWRHFISMCSPLFLNHISIFIFFNDFFFILHFFIKMRLLRHLWHLLLLEFSTWAFKSRSSSDLWLSSRFIYSIILKSILSPLFVVRQNHHQFILIIKNIIWPTTIEFVPNRHFIFN